HSWLVAPSATGGRGPRPGRERLPDRPPADHVGRRGRHPGPVLQLHPDADRDAPGLPDHHVRKVNQRYRHIAAWISSVGAGIAVNDLDGDGLSNDLCIVDTRSDRVVVTPTPGAGDHRYAPFALTYGTLPTSDTFAPMGCVPGDYNEDGRIDL